jgi:hypothetical protein
LGATTKAYRPVIATAIEADLRVRAAARLHAAGDTSAAEEQRRRAVTFYGFVGATERIREADALLPATA